MSRIEGAAYRPSSEPYRSTVLARESITASIPELLSRVRLCTLRLRRSVLTEVVAGSRADAGLAPAKERDFKKPMGSESH